MFNINDEFDKPFIIGFDYDGVITKRGSSGENEEKWLKREENFLWRKLLNFVSIIYNRYFSLNEEIIPVVKLLKVLGCKIIIITSHTLTTTNYKESEQTRIRVKNRLVQKHILYDVIEFVSGDKVAICQEYGVNLMVEDNIEKVKALRDAEIPTVPKKTNKNAHLLENDPDAIDDLYEVINIVLNKLADKELIKEVKNIVEDYKNQLNKLHEIDKTITQMKKPIFANFTDLAEEEDLSYNELFNSAETITEEKPHILKMKYKKQDI